MQYLTPIIEPRNSVRLFLVVNCVAILCGIVTYELHWAPSVSLVLILVTILLAPVWLSSRLWRQVRGQSRLLRSKALNTMALMSGRSELGIHDRGKRQVATMVAARTIQVVMVLLSLGLLFGLQAVIRDVVSSLIGRP